MFDKFTQVQGGAASAGMNIEWDAVERQIGSNLPIRYKQFIEQVSSGLIHDYLELYSPVTKSSWLKLQDAVPRTRKLIREMEDPNHFSLKEALGLESSSVDFLPIGETVDGDMVILLQLSEDPDDWSVASILCRDDMGYNTGLNFEQFMQALIDMVPIGDAFPDRLYDKSGEHIFVPHNFAS